MAPNSRPLPSGDKLSGLLERTGLRKRCKRRQMELENIRFQGVSSRRRGDIPMSTCEKDVKVSHEAHP